jgi:mannopine transport system permease protein
MVALGTAYILVFPDLIGSFLGVLLPTVIFNLVWMVRAVQSSLSVTDPAYEDAALMLGASRIRAFFTVTLPAIAPGIAVGAMITFANSTTAFTAPYFLGRTTALTTTVGIFNELSRNSLIPRLAAEALIVELIVMSFVVAAYLMARKRFRGLII